jgi:hypothetical protein
MTRMVYLGIAGVAALTAAPAFAGGAVATPAPLAGVGIGAVALLGLGYRALKKRIER